MNEENQILSEEDIVDQYTKLQNDTIPKILELLEEEQYNIAIVCTGLITIVRTLIKHYGNDELRNECIYYLQQDFDDVENVE